MIRWLRLTARDVGSMSDQGTKISTHFVFVQCSQKKYFKESRKGEKG